MIEQPVASGTGGEPATPAVRQGKEPASRHLRPGDALAALLDDGPIMAPGCFDCLSAAVMEQAGFKALFVSGAGVAASVLGAPDLGLLSFHELAQSAGAIIRRAHVPVIVDGDTGYGNELNTIRTITELGLLGAAAVTIEDQVFPKRCGHLEGKDVIPRSEYISKIRAARFACDTSGMLLIARTDALGVLGIDEALARAELAAEAGADVSFIEAPRDAEQLARIGSAQGGRWRAHNLATGSHGPSVTTAELGALGFSLVIEPGVSLYPAIDGMRRAARTVLDEGSAGSLKSYGMVPRNIFETVGLDDWLALEERFSDKTDPR